MADLEPLIDSITSLEHAVRALAVSAAERWASIGISALLAMLTFGAVVFAAHTARSANRSAIAAQEASDYARLRDLQAHFDESGYLMRFWRLFADVDAHQKEHGFWSRDISDLLKGKHEELWREALGGNPDSLRYDMLTFYDFALRLNAWLARSPGRAPSSKDVQLANEFFGPWLVGTMLKHRMVACTIRKSDRPEVYYPGHYGLGDEAYTQVVQVLLDDLLERNRLNTNLKRAFVQWNDKVSDQIEQLGESLTPT